MTWADLQARLEAAGIQDTDHIVNLVVHWDRPEDPETVTIQRWQDTLWPTPGVASWRVIIDLHYPCATAEEWRRDPPDGDWYRVS